MLTYDFILGYKFGILHCVLMTKSISKKNYITLRWISEYSSELSVVYVKPTLYKMVYWSVMGNNKKIRIRN
jgi:hypothetical protein